MYSPVFRITVCFAIAAGGAFADLPPVTELEAFIDGVMAAHEDAYPYAGAVVAIVADGQVYFQKGYGFADLESREPVDPERTLFRIGSVSKLFTWTGLMQLAEQGLIDLDAPANSYLKDVSIPDTFEEPITVAHLMNHTAGFEDRLIGLFGKSEETVKPLADLLNAQMPARVRPPGLVTSYSNHGTALAAMVLEDVSGELWRDYVAQHILAPLDMNDTVLAQPAPDATMSKGYANRNGLLEEQSFEYVPMAPAGAISATASDMARFMIAHLQCGELGEGRVLKEETAIEMQTRSFQNAPGVNGMAHGFMEMDRNGHRIVGHGGDTFWFHTLWAILPEHGVGIYASYNTDSGAAARSELFNDFIDRYFPAEEQAAPPAATIDSADLRRFVGQYRSNRMAYTTLEKLGALMGSARVTQDSDGALLFTGQETMRIAEIEPLLFQEVGGSRRVRFHESEDGEITKLFLDEIPVFAFDRIPRAESPALHFTLLVVALPVMLSGVIAWPAGAFRRRKDEPVFSQEHLPGAAKWTAWGASTALVLFVAGLVMTMLDPTQIVYGLPPHMPALLCLPLIAAALTYVAVLFGLLFLARSIASRWARIHYLAVVSACATVVWQLYTWNLLGFKY